MVLSNVDRDTSLYPKVSNSELYSIGRCKKMWSYSYEQGLVSANTPEYMSNGSYMHALMAAVLTSLKTDGVMPNVKALSMEVQTKALDSKDPTVDEPTRLRFVDQTEDYFAQLWTDKTEVIAVEQEFYADVGLHSMDGPPVLLHGIVDAVVRDSAGNLWLLEHKTSSRAWSTQQFEFATQDILYCMAWEKLTGERPMGVQYNFFYPKRWEVRNKFVGPEQYAEVLKDTQYALNLRHHIIGGVAPREPLYGCGGCQFRNLCYTELLGGDASYIRQNAFTVDPDRAARFTEVE